MTVVEGATYQVGNGLFDNCVKLGRYRNQRIWRHQPAIIRKCLCNGACKDCPSKVHDVW